MPTEPLSDVLRQAADTSPPPPDVERLYADLSARRRRRARVRTTATAGLAAAAVVAVVAVASSVDPARQGGGTGSPDAAGAARVWTALPSSPLSARHSPVAVAAGTEVLLIGGDPDRICPLRADCWGDDEGLPDGAAFDLSTLTWRRLPDAPAPPVDISTAVVGDTVYVSADGGGFLTFDVSANAWSTLPKVPGARDGVQHRLVAAGDVLVAYADTTKAGAADFVYNPAHRVWTPLPADPLGPSEGRQLAWADDVLILVAAGATGRSDPIPMQAAVLSLATGTWTRLPGATDIVYQWGWSWDGRRLINVSPETIDGGEVNRFDREYRTGGVLDIRTGTWSRVPGGAPPRRGASGIAVESERYKAWGGALYDTAADAWLALPAPPAGDVQRPGRAWVGDLLVVWGGVTRGSDGSSVVATGAVYGPATR